MLEFYNSINLETLQEWVTENRIEDLHIEFKEIRNIDLTSDDRKNFAKAISGFANSDSGIIVWGIEARKDQLTGVDGASNLKPIENAKTILTKFQSLTGQSTVPIVEGVLHRFIHDGSSNNNSGFIVTYVPRSDSIPHMAKNGENRYFKRSGDSFYVMEHFDLEDMFGRRQKPKLEIVCELSQAEGYDTATEELKFFITNNGRAVAKNAGTLIQIENMDIIRTTNALSNITNLNNGKTTISWNQPVGVLHPNHVKTFIGSLIFKRINQIGSVKLLINIYSEEMLNKQFTKEYGAVHRYSQP